PVMDVCAHAPERPGIEVLVDSAAPAIAGAAATRNAAQTMSHREFMDANLHFSRIRLKRSFVRAILVQRPVRSITLVRTQHSNVSYTYGCMGGLDPPHIEAGTVDGLGEKPCTE
ncbi:MAG: hypothetical protein KGO48_06405, partial [Alphaproteobacteria bacterium]|nr:hypothetical protein [Alphaproteobacteria bacterium]